MNANKRSLAEEITEGFKALETMRNNKPVAWMNSKGDIILPAHQANKEYNIPLYAHPAKELHLSLQKVKDTGELLAVTYTDDEHRIVEVLWQKPPALTDEEIIKVYEDMLGVASARSSAIEFARAILKKASEK